MTQVLDQSTTQTVEAVVVDPINNIFYLPLDASAVKAEVKAVRMYQDGMIEYFLELDGKLISLTYYNGDFESVDTLDEAKHRLAL